MVGKWGHRHWRDGLFVQDDWKVPRNFTFNLGMRWEYTSAHLRSCRSPGEHQHRLRASCSIAGKDGNSRALYNPYYKQFEPRVGFAWNPKLRSWCSAWAMPCRASWKAPAPTCGCRSIRRSSSNPTSTTTLAPRGHSPRASADVSSAGTLDRPAHRREPGFYQGTRLGS